MILEFKRWKRSSTKIILSNIIGPLPNKSYEPSEKFKQSSRPLPKKSDALSKKVKKQAGIWMVPKTCWSLLLTRLKKKGLLTQLKKGKKSNVVEEANTSTISEKNKIGAVNKNQKWQS